MTVPDLKEFKITDGIPDSIPEDVLEFKGTFYDYDGESVDITIFDSDYFVENVIALYRNRLIMLPEDTPVESFIALFDAWADSRIESYMKMAYDLVLKYDPMHDYNWEEELKNDKTEYLRNKRTKETTPYNFEETEITPYTLERTETTPYTDETTTNTVSAFNTSGYVDSDKSTFKRTGKETVDLTKTGTEKHKLVKNGKEKVETSWAGNDSDTRNYKKTRKGTGSKPVPELIRIEFDNLMIDLAFRALYEFVDRYTYYCEEVG